MIKGLRHGLRYTRIYGVYKNMFERCYNPKNKRYSNYGGRGIKVCKRWHNLENFFKDMGQPPEGLTLDRINNNKSYSPENCRWATMYEQQRNTSRNRLLTLNGKTQTMMDWANEMNIKYDTIRARKSRYGYSDEEALTKPLQWSNR